MTDRVRWVADLGNRFTKIGLIRAGTVAERIVFPSRALRDDGTWADDTLAAAGRRAVERAITETGAPTGAVPIASVNPPADAAFRAWLAAQFGVDAIVLGRDVAVPLRHDVTGVGTDRLVNALAALARFPDGAIAVDIGTAITVDAARDGDRFLGGAILEGPHLAARALNDYTAKLPAIDPVRPDRAIATATESAIASGIYHGALGGVLSLVEAFRAELGFAAPAVFTGGDTPLFADDLAARCAHAVFAPNLTLEGVYVAAERAS